MLCAFAIRLGGHRECTATPLGFQPPLRPLRIQCGRRSAPKKRMYSVAARFPAVSQPAMASAAVGMASS